MKILKLAKPLLVNGKKRTELKYDTSILTISDLSNAETLKFKLVPAEQAASSVAQTDNILHLCVAVMAVLRCEPEVSEEDMQRLEGYDVVQLSRIGQRFFIGSASEIAENSETQQEVTQEVTSAQ